MHILSRLQGVDKLESVLKKATKIIIGGKNYHIKCAGEVAVTVFTRSVCVKFTIYTITCWIYRSNASINVDTSWTFNIFLLLSYWTFTLLLFLFILSSPFLLTNYYCLHYYFIFLLQQFFDIKTCKWLQCHKQYLVWHCVMQFSLSIILAVDRRSRHKHRENC